MHEVGKGHRNLDFDLRWAPMTGDSSVSDQDSGASERPSDALLDRILRGEGSSSASESALGLTAEESEAAAALARAMGLAPPLGESNTLATEPDLPLSHVGEFRLLAKIGEGSLGMVFRAEQPSVGRQVAVKLLRPGLLLSKEADLRLAREAHALAKLRHPNIVTVITSGQDQGIRYLAMEYVEGEGLDHLIDRARRGEAKLAVPQVLTWMAELAQALEAAHSVGILHRDVKPANIRIHARGHAVLLDFGLAQDRPDSSLTATGAFRGSPRYASPEQVSEEGAPLDGRTDVYSLGVVLYEALTLTPPFDGRTTEALFARILAGDPPSPRKLIPDLSRELEVVTLKALERRREQRYATAADLARDLQALLALREIQARPPGPMRRLRAWTRKHRVLAAGVAAIGLALSVLAGTLIARKALDRRAFVREMAAATSAGERGEFEIALSACDRALGLDPKESSALILRSSLVQRRDHHRASTLLREARELLASATRSRSTGEAKTRELGRLQRAMSGRTLTIAEGAILARGGGRIREDRMRVEADLHAAQNRALDARSIASDPDEVSALLAAIAMERWREAEARGDTEAQRLFEAQVREHDRPGTHEAELRGWGSLSLEVVPNDATVHLFRYESQADVVPDGELRLVPVPVGDAPSPIPAGSWCLQPNESREGWTQDDLVIALDGRTIGPGLWVSSDRGDVQRGDFLICVDGTEVHLLRDLAFLVRVPENPSVPRRFRFDRAGTPFTIEAATLTELGVQLGPAWEYASRHGGTATVWAGSRQETRTIPEGLTFRGTAAPLFLIEKNALSGKDLVARQLLPGSYLAHVAAPGMEPQRIPFRVLRQSSVVLRAELRAVGSTPFGFSYIPAGPAILGRSYAQGEGSVAEAVHSLPGFSIMQREVTTGAWLEFVNDPKVAPEHRAAPVGLLPSRTRDHSVWRLLTRDETGRWSAPPQILGIPAGGVSFVQAAAFADWKSAKSRADSNPITYTIPTDLEWEKAARGADGRPYPYGHTFHPQWQKTGRATLQMSFDMGHRFPIDESPYGVLDSLGGVCEWCDVSDATKGERKDRSLRGSSWAVADDRALFNEWVMPPESALAEAGFRLVIRDPQ